MKYSKLFHLKFERGFSTYELMKQYPCDAKRIGEIALLDLDEITLKKVLPERDMVSHLMHLKQKFMPVGGVTDHCESRVFKKHKRESAFYEKA